jgi:hypothetical protein
MILKLRSGSGLSMVVPSCNAFCEQKYPPRSPEDLENRIAMHWGYDHAGKIQHPGAGATGALNWGAATAINMVTL